MLPADLEMSKMNFLTLSPISCDPDLLFPFDTDAGGGMLINALHNLLNRIRDKKEITGEWKRVSL